MSCAPCDDETVQSLILADEGDSGVIIMTLRDENGDLVEKAAINSILLTLYNAATEEIINSRSAQGVLDANGGAYFDDLQTTTDEDGNEVSYNFSWDYDPADTPFLKTDSAPQQTETHVAHFRFTWNGGDDAKSIVLRMVVTNIRLFEVA